jgi:ATP-dependent Lhr-like helicase
MNTAWSHAIANQLLSRYGVLTRESVAQENLPGGFSAVYDVLKAFEESGRVRRGYFVAGLGATQFALPAAVDLLRSLRSNAQPEKPEMVAIAATDPANPYGSVLRWPSAAQDLGDVGEGGAALAATDTSGQVAAEAPARTLTRSVGATVVLRNGELVAYLRRNNPNIQVFLPAEEHFLARFLQDAGFQVAPLGFNVRRMLLPAFAQESASGSPSGSKSTEVQ